MTCSSHLFTLCPPLCRSRPAGSQEVLQHSLLLLLLLLPLQGHAGGHYPGLNWCDHEAFAHQRGWPIPQLIEQGLTSHTWRITYALMPRAPTERLRKGPSQAHENRRCFPAGMLLQLLLHRRLLQRAAQIGAELFLMLEETQTKLLRIYLQGFAPYVNLGTRS